MFNYINFESLLTCGASIAAIAGIVYAKKSFVLTKKQLNLSEKEFHIQKAEFYEKESNIKINLLGCDELKNIDGNSFFISKVRLNNLSTSQLSLNDCKILMTLRKSNGTSGLYSFPAIEFNPQVNKIISSYETGQLFNFPLRMEPKHSVDGYIGIKFPNELINDMRLESIDVEIQTYDGKTFKTSNIKSAQEFTPSHEQINKQNIEVISMEIIGDPHNKNTQKKGRNTSLAEIYANESSICEISINIEQTSWVFEKLNEINKYQSGNEYGDVIITWQIAKEKTTTSQGDLFVLSFKTTELDPMEISFILQIKKYSKEIDYILRNKKILITNELVSGVYQPLTILYLNHIDSNDLWESTYTKTLIDEFIKNGFNENDAKIKAELLLKEYRGFK